MRVLLKLSGEVLGGTQGMGLDERTLKHYAGVLSRIAEHHQVAVVTGGGNIMRGKATQGLDRSKADQIGMMATVVNCMTLEQHLVAVGTRACAMSSVPSLAQPYDIVRARELLSQGTIVVVAGGTSNPYFTTDSAAALRAASHGRGPPLSWTAQSLSCLLCQFTMQFVPQAPPWPNHCSSPSFSGALRPSE